MTNTECVRTAWLPLHILHAGTHNGAGPAAALPSPAAVVSDCDVTDDGSAPSAPEAAAAQAEQDASAAAGSVRAATLQQLQDLKSRFEQVSQGPQRPQRWGSSSPGHPLLCWPQLVCLVHASHGPLCGSVVCVQVLEANAAAAADQQLSDAELVLNSQLLQQLRGEVAAEEAALLSEAPRRSLEQEVQAKRLKALCWDAFQVRYDHMCDTTHMACPRA